MAFPNFFTPRQQQPQQQQPTNQQQPHDQQQQAIQQNMPGGTPTNGNATVPNNNNNQNQQQNNQNAQNQSNNNPLDVYSKLFDNPSTEGNAPPAFAIDSKVMDQVVSSQDFTQGIDPAVMQKAMQGDAQSFIDIIQHVGRSAYRASIEHGGMLTDKFVGAREKHGEGRISSKVRSELTTHALSSNTPNFQHPVVRRQLSEIATRFQQQNPEAGPQEIADMAKKYMTDLMQAINPENTQQSQNQRQVQQEERGAEYWDKFFQD